MRRHLYTMWLTMQPTHCEGILSTLTKTLFLSYLHLRTRLSCNLIVQIESKYYQNCDLSRFPGALLLLPTSLPGPVKKISWTTEVKFLSQTFSFFRQRTSEATGYRLFKEFLQAEYRAERKSITWFVGRISINRIGIEKQYIEGGVKFWLLFEFVVVTNRFVIFLE